MDCREQICHERAILKHVILSIFILRMFCATRVSSSMLSTRFLSPIRIRNAPLTVACRALHARHNACKGSLTTSHLHPHLRSRHPQLIFAKAYTNGPAKGSTPDLESVETSSELSLTTEEPVQTEAEDPPKPRLSITFTCIVPECFERSTHQFTKHSYERGIVIIMCPKCKNRSVFAVASNATL